MATPNVGILTNAGKNLIDQVNAGQTKITFSKIVFSSMNNNQLTDDQIKALTAITPQEIVVNNPKVTLDNNTGETRIRATGNNETLTDGVYVKTYAVFAKDDSGNEILYGLTVSPNPNYLPEYDGVTPQAVTYSYKVNISNTSNITFTNSNDVYVSDTDLTEALQPYAKTIDVNQQLDNKVNVSDMRKPASDVAGIDEVSTLQTQVDNSAVGTNLYADTKNFDNIALWNVSGGDVSKLWTKITDAYNGFSVMQTTQSWGGLSQYVQVKKGDVLTYSVYAKYISGTGTSVIYWTLNSPTEGNYSGATATNITNCTVAITDSWQRVSGTAVATSDGYLRPRLERETENTNTLQVAGIKVEKGSVVTDWCPNSEDKADDSKVVHTADMRKPANDVAGIEEVNAKQDKIGYTPADDSKVVHYDSIPNSLLRNYLTSGTDLNTITSPGIFPFNQCTFVNDINSAVKWGELVNNVLPNQIIRQEMIIGNGQVYGYRIYNSGNETWSSWLIPADDSKVLHSTVTELDSTDLNTVLTTGFYQLISGTNGMPNADRYAIYQVINLVNSNGVQLAYGTNNAILGMRSWNAYGNNFTSWIQLSDDSKVAHLSGANNFDTTPTVNKNPLLLASSLPADLARLSQDANFTAKLQQNGQDVALANNTIARNPDTGTVSETNTFTATQTFSIAPVINDASTSKGDNQAATMADLKSVEADAWHVAEPNYPGLLMQVDRDDKIIYILSTGNTTTTRPIDTQNSQIICDLSSYIDKIISASGHITIEGDQFNLGFTGAKLLANFHGTYIDGGGYSVSGDPGVLNNTSAFLKLQYNSWIGK